MLPEVAPLFQNSWRLRLQNQVVRVSTVLAIDSEFIHAIIRISPVSESWTMAGISPAESNLRVSGSTEASIRG
jgi:hypothetical protein